MFQIKRFVALACLGLQFASVGCSTSSYATAAAEPKMANADMAVRRSPLEPAKEEVMSTRSFESVASVAPGAMESDEMWSGGEVGGSDKKSDGLREEFPLAPPPPPPPPPPGFAMQNPAPGPQRQLDGQPKPTDLPATTPTGTGKKDAENAASESTSAQHAPMLIYTGNVQMAVYEVRNSLGEVETMARSLGGFLAKRDDHSITIRVPAARFEDALRRIEKLGDMISREVQVEDVTEEFNDVDIRLKNARAVRDRLEQLLTKAAKVEESIQIERELERVALQIERLEGRMKFLKDRAAYSTITVNFQPRSAAELGKRPFNLPVPWLYELGLGRLLSL